MPTPPAPPSRPPSPSTPAPQARGLGLLALLLLANVALVGLLTYYAQDELRGWLGKDADAAKATGSEAKAAVEEDDDADGVVMLNRNAMRAGGIATSKLEAAAGAVTGQAAARAGGSGAQTAASGVAIVPSLAPLFDLRARYQAQQGDISAARVAQARSAAELRRMRTLHADDRNVSASALEVVQAQAQQDQARLLQAQAAATATVDAVRQSWGRELAEALSGDDRTRLLRRLASRDQILVQAGFLRGGTPPSRIWISTIEGNEPAGGVGGDAQAAGAPREQAAHLIGPAIATDPSLPPTTYLYRTEPGNLRSGARLRVRVDAPAIAAKAGEPPTGTDKDDEHNDKGAEKPGPALADQGADKNGQKAKATGKGADMDKDDAPAAPTLVPFSAVVWHAGQAWAYVIEGESERGIRFERRAVDTRQEAIGGWMQTQRYAPGEQIVTTGAQWLLSRELRPRSIDND